LRGFLCQLKKKTANLAAGYLNVREHYKMPGCKDPFPI
jgi:hypothetical protein